MENSDIVVIVVTDLKIWAQLYFLIYIEIFSFPLSLLANFARFEGNEMKERKILRTIHNWNEIEEA
jgi:hypothetical protein